jgi:hypothetical protein
MTDAPGGILPQGWSRRKPGPTSAWGMPPYCVFKEVEVDAAFKECTVKCPFL